MLAYDMLLTTGHFGDRPPIGEGDRIPLHSSINNIDGCLIRNAIVSVSSELPHGFVLPSGKVGFFTFTGVTDTEIAFAKESDPDVLIERLKTAGQYPITDPGRASVL
ncbi:MAG: hypothetical protein JWL86_4691 [Rhizobium sp.]|nr:hypothetical protein [Rhizobium sp.]